MQRRAHFAALAILFITAAATLAGRCIFGA